MVKKTMILLVLYFSQVYLLVRGEKNILPNLTDSQEPLSRFFGLLELEPEPEPLGKKIRAGEPLKYLPAP